MLLHVTLVIDDSTLQKKLETLLVSSNTLVEIVRNHRRLVSKLSQRVCDVAIISRQLVGLDAIGPIQKLKELTLPSLQEIMCSA